MRYEIRINKMDYRHDRIICSVYARSPYHALLRAGYRPDTENDSTSGAEPRNEYGNPWFPHIQAVEAPIR